MYNLENKNSGAKAQVTDAEWEAMKTKKISEDPQEKKSWASKFKVLGHQPDIAQPAATFNPPEIAIPEIHNPPAAAEVKEEKAKGNGSKKNQAGK